MSHLTLDAQALYRDLLQHMQQLVASHLATHAEPPLLVGIASGGVWLAERLQADLNLPGKSGTLSSSMHRDDFAERGLACSAQTALPYDVNGAHLILIDDVLYTGRTLRAVINELFDYGRPASVKLVVLVDRGGRELPVQPDLAIARVTLPADQSLALTRLASGAFSFELQSR
ncbi:MAG: bifunctional pyr operon transcriptional regulator/uracil phosphoribosyltransferase PyrR [Chitinophagaceae bacterium]|nr:bifunctional pyr operon transcriptional regulator/uracil phosphoribosyltransferase PyrR [Polaromonas sp.]